jgi:hypothetical protein
VKAASTLWWLAAVGACWPSPWSPGRRGGGGRWRGVEAPDLCSRSDEEGAPELCCWPTRRLWPFRSFGAGCGGWCWVEGTEGNSWPAVAATTLTTPRWCGLPSWRFVEAPLPHATLLLFSGENPSPGLGGDSATASFPLLEAPPRDFRAEVNFAVCGGGW